ncbi:hypothetical protein [Streptomyces sp. NPDC002187]|uniref:hypothetical protein n=1 Tax=Streptomyces sp. NPDC002187 TaxID=3364637 RepID=UPI0036870560
MTVDRHGMDAVALAMIGEPVPADAERDPQVAAAAADAALLREQLRFIGDHLAREPAARAVQRPARGRRRLVMALAASVATAAVGLAGAYLGAHNGTGAGGAGAAAEDSAKLTPEGQVACAAYIVEGTVAQVEALGGGRGLRVDLVVERSYTPQYRARRDITFTASGDGEDGYFRSGVRMLVMVSRFPGEDPITFREGDAAPLPPVGDDVGPVRDSLGYGRKWVEKALPGARGVECRDRG